MSPTQVGSQSQNAETWNRFVQSGNVIYGYFPPSVTVKVVPAQSVQTEPESKEDKPLFGTHIREAVRALRG